MPIEKKYAKAAAATAIILFGGAATAWAALYLSETVAVVSGLTTFLTATYIAIPKSLIREAPQALVQPMPMLNTPRSDGNERNRNLVRPNEQGQSGGPRNSVQDPQGVRGQSDRSTETTL